MRSTFDRGAVRRVFFVSKLAVPLLIALSLLLAWPTSSIAQAVAISAFSDPDGGSCTLNDDQEGPLGVYVMVDIAPGTGLVGSRFRVSASGGFAADYISEAIYAPFYWGDLQNGIEIQHTSCETGTFLVASMLFQGHGTSTQCSYLEVAPHPQSYTGGIDINHCEFLWFAGSTKGRLLVNSSGDCAPWCVIATQTTTWGGVKALYR